MWLGMLAGAVAQADPVLAAPLNALNGPLVAFVARVADVAAPAPQPATSTSGLICIEFPGGVRVSVDGSVDAGALARVLSVLR